MQLGIVQLIKPFSGQYNNINSGQAVLAQAKRFANDTLYAISLHGQADIFFGDNKAKAGVLQAVFSCQHQQMPTRDLGVYLVKNGFEGGSVKQAF